MSIKTIKTKNGDYKVVMTKEKDKSIVPMIIKEIFLFVFLLTISYGLVSCTSVNSKQVMNNDLTDVVSERIKEEVVLLDTKEIDRKIEETLLQASEMQKLEDVKVKSMGAIETDDINCKRDSKIIMSDGTIKKCVFKLSKGSKLNVGDRIVGEASHYGHNDGTNGSKTADGSRFNKYAMTAASNVYPLGSTVKVTNIKNGKSVQVKITDTGGFYKNKYQRVVDMSYGSMRKITSGDLAYVDIVRIK